MYGYFTHGTDPPSRRYSSGFLSLPNRLRRLPSPIHFRSPIARSHSFHCVCGTTQPSVYWQSVARPFAFAYRSTYSGATQRLCQSSLGHALFFRSVPSAITLVRWVDENAFALMVQARPIPPLADRFIVGGPH